MEKKNRKIGIMGGTFDPIHIGHLILGEAAYEQFGLDEVWFLPAGNPPHKRNRAGRAKNAQRVEMVRRAIASNPHFVLCTRGGGGAGGRIPCAILMSGKIQSGSAPRQ